MNEKLLKNIQTKMDDIEKNIKYQISGLLDLAAMINVISNLMVLVPIDLENKTEENKK